MPLNSFPEYFFVSFVVCENEPQGFCLRDVFPLRMLTNGTSSAHQELGIEIVVLYVCVTVKFNFCSRQFHSLYFWHLFVKSVLQVKRHIWPEWPKTRSHIHSLNIFLRKPPDRSTFYLWSTSRTLGQHQWVSELEIGADNHIINGKCLYTQSNL